MNDTTTGRKATRTSRDYRVFLSAALRRPGVIGSVVPSSAALAETLASVVPSLGAPVVVELGPGTGAVSAAIGRRLPAGARHLAVEVDAGMVEHLRLTRPTLEVVHGDAANLVELLAGHGVDRVDAVVSGLPWSLFDAESQRRILDQVGRLLTTGGAFTTFGYLHARPLVGARRFYRQLPVLFDEVITTWTEWRNLPPARVYVCRRPVRCG